MPPSEQDRGTALPRFLEAQAQTYSQAREELSAGQKESHWMWFVFPQIQGLGNSPMARLYAIQDMQEAITYLQHPMLGSRLRACTQLVNRVLGKSAHDIFGSPDDLKFHSSMTLFAEAAKVCDKQEDLFQCALEKYFEGLPDPATLKLLGL